jgi:hypothetical protein
MTTGSIKQSIVGFSALYFSEMSFTLNARFLLLGRMFDHRSKHQQFAVEIFVQLKNCIFCCSHNGISQGDCMSVITLAFEGLGI